MNRLGRAQTPPRCSLVGTHLNLLTKYRTEHPATENLNVSERAGRKN
jgi:hypothetical protein